MGGQEPSPALAQWETREPPGGVQASVTGVPRPTEMMLATDGVRAAQGVEEALEPEPQGRATSEEGQAYPAQLALAQGRVSRQPPY